jgi:hypothetical protein
MIASGWNGYLKSFPLSGCGADCHGLSMGLRNPYRQRIKIAREKFTADHRTNPHQAIHCKLFRRVVPAIIGPPSSRASSDKNTGSPGVRLRKQQQKQS